MRKWFKRFLVAVPVLVAAIVLAVWWLLRGSLPALDGELAHHVYNVGTGKGASVAEVIDAIGEASGLDATPVVEARRAGDPPQLIASADRIEHDLGFRSETGLGEIVASAWEAWQAGPRRISV